MRTTDSRRVTAPRRDTPDRPPEKSPDTIVDESSEASFPASDPPAWTPTTRIGRGPLGGARQTSAVLFWRD